jgi:hypothetical protein
MTPAPVRNDSVTIRPAGSPVACGACGHPFGRSGRRRYCSDRCRQAGWRQRQAPAPAAAPVVRRQRATVYACGECERRLLGEQWCPDCQRPCRRIGPGGLCPHCDEPVALSDLAGETADGPAASPVGRGPA